MSQKCFSGTNIFYILVFFRDLQLEKMEIHLNDHQIPYSNGISFGLMNQINDFRRITLIKKNIIISKINLLFFSSLEIENK